VQSYKATLTTTMVRTGLFLKSFTLDHRRGLVLSFVFGFVLRLIPEVLSYPYPIGFDTIHYAARMKNGVVWYHWTSVFSTWLLYAALIQLYQVVQVDPFLLLKLVAPFLYALNVCGVYYFSRRALNWSARRSLIAAFFFAFQLASLRLSWDLHRNVLGMGILLFTLPWIRKLETKRGFALFLLLSMLVVLSQEYVSVVMFAVVSVVMARKFLKGDMRRLLRVSAAVSPALALFLTSVYLRMFPVSFLAESNVTSAYQPAAPPGGLFFLVNYFSPSLGSVQYPTYVNLASHFFSLFAVLYLLSLPLVLVGFFRERLLDGWTLLLLAGSFSSVIIPFAALIYWDRWMIMLVYPFTFYAVNGMEKVLTSKGTGVRPSLRWMRWMKVSTRTVYGILFLTVFFGFLLMTVRFRDDGVFAIPTTGIYLPSTMLQNTVPLRDVGGTVDAMEWLNRLDDDSGVLVHHAFLWWARLYLGKENMIVHFRMNVEAAFNVALGNGFNSVYLVWWNENISWYRLSVPKDFVAVFSSGRISVFEYFQ
jgi:hypothetical protein